MPKHVVIYSHGFGVKKDSRGMFTEISNSLANMESVLFDYNEIDPITNDIHVRPFPEQIKIFNEVLSSYVNSDTVIDIVAHSQGCLVVALAKPRGIRKTILLAPTFSTNSDKLLEIFRSRPGTVIDKEGISKIARRDGSFTIVPSSFWTAREDIEPIDFYNALAETTDLVIVHANQDDVLPESPMDSLSKKIKIVDLDGDHNFNGTARPKLIETVKTLLT